MTIDRIRAAADRLRGRARQTPLLNTPALDAIAGRPVWVKAESLQHTGSFKYRGATAAVTALTEAEAKGGVIAYSSGNHAQGVARAAAERGIPAVIVMPADAPPPKLENTRALGAEVVLYDRGGEESREAIGARLAETRGLTLIPPYDAEEVIAGQGTVGLDLVQDLAAAGVHPGDVLVCCGGGGLTSGIALALEAEAPDLRVRPVEPEGFDDVRRSLAAHAIRTNSATTGSICDAILTPAPGRLTFAIMDRLCGPGLAVSDAAALRAMALAFRHLRIVLEPGGAVALAAALWPTADLRPGPVVAIASGGNVEAATFLRALQSETQP